MRKLGNIIIVLLVVITFFLRMTSYDQELMSQWEEYKHERLVKSIEPIDLQNPKVTWTETNLNNLGTVLETDDFIYIVFDGLHLEKTDKDLNTIEVLKSKSQGYHMGHLQLIDQWLYYRSNGIHRINVDTKKEDTVYSEGVNELFITEDYIYFTDYMKGMKLFRMGLNGENPTSLNDSSILDVMMVEDGFIAIKDLDLYYELVKIDFDGNEEVIESPFGAHQMQMVGDDLFYRDQKSMKLMRMSLQTKDKEIIVDQEINYFSMDQGDIYYSLKDQDSDFGDGLGIYKLTEDGDTIPFDDETLLSMGNINITGKYIIYESDYKTNPFGSTIVKKDGTDGVVLHRGMD